MLRVCHAAAQRTSHAAPHLTMLKPLVTMRKRSACTPRKGGPASGAGLRASLVTQTHEQRAPRHSALTTPPPALATTMDGTEKAIRR